MEVRRKRFHPAIFLSFLALSFWAWPEAPAAGEDPGAAARHAEADRYFKEGIWDKTIELHRELLRRDPGNAAAHYHLGYAYSQQGKHRGEIEEYRVAIRLGLEDADLFFNLGMALMEIREAPEESLEALRAAVKHNRNKDEYFVGLGLAYLARADYPSAIEAFSEGIRLNSAHVEARLSLGLAYAALRRYSEARAQWEKVLELDPGNPSARFHLERLKRVEAQEGGPAPK